jgi:CheY-like chemotaxis protein
MARVLIVEDDLLVGGMMERALMRAGHEVAVTVNGRAGLAALRASDDFDAVITDLFMPECDGIELIRQIRAQHAGVPILAISGGGNCGYRQLLAMSSLLGAAATLRKPFTNLELAGALDTLLQDTPSPLDDPADERARGTCAQ